jgi:hypothetical protein
MAGSRGCADVQERKSPIQPSPEDIPTNATDCLTEQQESTDLNTLVLNQIPGSIGIGRNLLLVSGCY